MPKKIPQRMCVACRTMKPKRELIRIVISPDGDIAIDQTGRKPGRGAYVCRRRSCLEQAIRAHRIDKGLRTAVGEAITRQLIEQMEAMPETDASD